VEVSVANGFLILEVSNSVRLEFSWWFARGSGVGLENLRRRLSLVFNGSGRLELTQEGDQVVARVFLPQPDAEERD
jgi:LytS/YehU family sensor histidine kinase